MEMGLGYSQIMETDRSYSPITTYLQKKILYLQVQKQNLMYQNLLIVFLEPHRVYLVLIQMEYPQLKNSHLDKELKVMKKVMEIAHSCKMSKRNRQTQAKVLELTNIVQNVKFCFKISLLNLKREKVRWQKILKLLFNKTPKRK